MADDLDLDYDEDEELEDEEEDDPYEEINQLKQKLSLLQKAKESQRSRYKKEMQMVIDALLVKHKETQKENHFLQKQIEELMGEGNSAGGGIVAELKQSLNDQKKEVSTMRKMVRNYEIQHKMQQQDAAELETLRELIDEKDLFVGELEEKNRELSFQMEAKDEIISRYSTQVADLEAEVYAMNKRIASSGSQSSQVHLQEVNRLKQHIKGLEEKRAYFEKLARQAYQESGKASQSAASTEAPSGEGYDDAMDMLLEELQENLSAYDEISTQVSKARV